jgi:hypothetical protein
LSLLIVGHSAARAIFGDKREAARILKKEDDMSNNSTEIR